ncbi:hypothetical protein M758_6G181800 [Ceratodon purpureus]|nr:hypothetical protein M758_6G181800 [Ceratodon purpureus]
MPIQLVPAHVLSSLVLHPHTLRTFFSFDCQCELACPNPVYTLCFIPQTYQPPAFCGHPQQLQGYTPFQGAHWNSRIAAAPVKSLFKLQASNLHGSFHFSNHLTQSFTSRQALSSHASSGACIPPQFASKPKTMEFMHGEHDPFRPIKLVPLAFLHIIYHHKLLTVEKKTDKHEERSGENPMPRRLPILKSNEIVNYRGPTSTLSRATITKPPSAVLIY